MSEEENYLIKSRAEQTIKKHGSVQKAIEYLKSELNEFENLWSMYSCDCLGHGITCNRMMITILNECTEDTKSVQQ